MADNLTHFDEAGRPRMVDVSSKASTARRAVAKGAVKFSKEAFAVIRDGGLKKGDIGPVAELAGVMGAKKTADLIPLCHPLPISGLTVKVEADEAAHAMCVIATVKTNGQTGVEMEALTAVMTACLTIYDMAKSIDKSITITDVMLIEKSGGASGDYIRDQ